MGIQRKTKSVQALIHFFAKRDSAINGTELINHFKQEMDKTTVYRILSRLEDEGMIHSFTGIDGLTWYASCDEHCSNGVHRDSHPHFQCRSCGKMECLDIKVTIPHSKDHEISSAFVLLSGKCDECLA